MLLTWRFFQAFGASVGSVITQTILRDSYEGAERTKLFSVMSAALAFSPAIGPLLGGFVSELLGWRGNFWVLSLLAILLFIWTWLSLPETRPTQLSRLSFKSLSQLGGRMMSDHQLWGHILLIGMTNAILFGFYQEAPFIFIEQLGMQPSHYGLFGLLIAAATILAARLSYRLSTQYSSQVLIQAGALCVFLGGVALTGVVAMGILEFRTVGIVTAITMLFVIFFGVGLIIPNSLSHALKSYQSNAGTAGSIFGGCYYLLIALCTWIMGAIHTGTALPLPLYIAFLGLVIVGGSQIIKGGRVSPTGRVNEGKSI
jgi:predicted MFS family arabinose efflux permease